MVRTSHRLGAIAVTIPAALSAAVMAACSGGPPLPSLPAASQLAELGKLSPRLPRLMSESPVIAVNSAETYSRVARGANRCWFGGTGRIATTHIFHADAAPSMNGGAVEIVVHERAVDQPKPWGFKAFRVTVTEVVGLDGTPGGGGASLGVENLRMGEAEAARMRAEVFQWASGTDDCKSDPELDRTASAAASKPAPATPAAKLVRHKMVKPKKAAAQSAAGGRP